MVSVRCAELDVPQLLRLLAAQEHPAGLAVLRSIRFTLVVAGRHTVTRSLKDVVRLQRTLRRQVGHSSLHSKKRCVPPIPNLIGDDGDNDERRRQQQQQQKKHNRKRMMLMMKKKERNQQQRQTDESINNNNNNNNNNNDNNNNSQKRLPWTATVDGLESRLDGSCSILESWFDRILHPDNEAAPVLLESSDLRRFLRSNPVVVDPREEDAHDDNVDNEPVNQDCLSVPPVVSGNTGSSDGGCCRLRHSHGGRKVTN